MAVVVKCPTCEGSGKGVLIRLGRPPKPAPCATCKGEGTIRVA